MGRMGISQYFDLRTMEFSYGTHIYAHENVFQARLMKCRFKSVLFSVVNANTSHCRV